MTKKRPKLLWITDPWNTLDHSKDTTLRFAQEAHSMGAEQYWCDVKSIRLDRFSAFLDAQKIISVEPARTSDSFKLGPSKTLAPDEFNSIHYRTDPPVDAAYLHPLQILSLGLLGKKTTEVVNPLDVLLTLNEKIEGAALGDLMPPSLVSCEWERLLAFGKAEKRTVLKPLHEAQSHGIELLDWRNADGIENSRLKLEQATGRFQTPVILQRYFEEIAQGEIRLWFLDGKLLAFAKKLPISGDFRVDIDRGSQLVPVKLSKKDHLKAEKIGKHLKRRKIRLAAIDLISGYVTDFNFTSPGLISQMESVLKVNLAKPIVKLLLRPSPI